MPAEWTTPDQKKFLLSKLDRYIELQALKQTDEMWPELYAGYFQLWPAEVDPETGKDMREVREPLRLDLPHAQCSACSG